MFVTDGPQSVSISSRDGQLLSHGGVLECTSEGNPLPSYHWTASLSDSDTNTTSNGSEFLIDVCRLTDWNRTSERRNYLSGTTRLTLTCQAQNMVGGQIRTASVQEVYTLVLPTNMDKVCGECILQVLSGTYPASHIFFVGRGWQDIFGDQRKNISWGTAYVTIHRPMETNGRHTFYCRLFMTRHIHHSASVTVSCFRLTPRRSTSLLCYKLLI